MNAERFEPAMYSYCEPVTFAGTAPSKTIEVPKVVLSVPALITSKSFNSPVLPDDITSQRWATGIIGKGGGSR